MKQRLADWYRELKAEAKIINLHYQRARHSQPPPGKRPVG